MKKLFISILAIAALVGCSKDDVINLVQGEVISFGDPYVDNSTKVIDPSYGANDITTFNVYGTVDGGQGEVLIYNATPVTKGNAQYGQAWTCNITQYWIEGADYTFTALVDVADDNVTKTTIGMPESFSYIAANQKDVLCKTVTVQGQEKGSNGIVGFTFTHLLSKAYFTVTNSTPDTKYTYTISNVKVTNAFANGVYTIANKSWAGSNIGAVTFSNIENVVNGTPQTSTTEVLLIPGATVGVSFDVTLSINGTAISTYKYEKANVAIMTANSIYNFNITLAPNDPIQFTVTEKPNWDATTGVEL